MSTPGTSPQEMTLLFRKLGYAKWLLEKGIEQSEADDELSHLVAIAHFFNAVEITTGAIVLHNGWCKNKSLPHAFDAVLDLLAKQGTDKVVTEPPSRHRVGRLKDLRNSVMHHAYQFRSSEMADSRDTCELFLKEACQVYLSLDIDEVSLTALIRDTWMKTLIREAETKLQSKLVKEALADLVWAFIRVEERLVALIVQRQGRSLQMPPHLLNPNPFIVGLSEDPGSKALEDIKAALGQHLQMLAEEIERVRQASNRGIILSVLETSSALRYLQTAPLVKRLFDPRTGEFDLQVEAAQVSRADVQAALNFVVGSVLRAESFGIRDFGSGASPRKKHS